jgi:hypothetical protein
MNPKHICLVALLAATPAFAQGNFLYTWHGDYGLFQASFQVTSAENQPGAEFRTSTFTSSIQIVSPDTTFHYTWPQDIAQGSFGPPLRLSITVDDPNTARQVAALAHDGWAVVSEFDSTTSAQLWAENGYWDAVQVPEPSAPAVIPLEAILWLGRGESIRTT